MEKVKVLLIHRFFYPDSPPYAFILDDIRVMLKKEKYDVDVLSSKPSYKISDKEKKEKIVTKYKDGSVIYRLPVFKLKKQKIEKLLNFILFPILVFWFLIFSRKYDTISVSTSPPVILAFFVSLAVRIKKSKLIYHCMDIYPEIGSLSGEFKNKYIYKLLEIMDNFTCNTASKIIVLSNDMKESLLIRNNKLSEKIEIINNYDLSDLTVKENIKKENNFKFKSVVYAGNIGRFQNLESFIFALKENPYLENFELIFVGDGTALKYLKEISLLSKTKITFIPHQSISNVRKIIAKADMAIVSLQKNVVKYAYPSKVMTYLSEGIPLLLSLDSETEISNFIESNQLGIYVGINDNRAIYEVFKKISENKIKFDEQLIKEIFNKNFSKDIFNNKFLSMIKSIKGNQ